MTGLAPALQRLLDILNRLGAPYLIGGSVASGSYGLPRQTNDIDIVADFRNVDMRSFCENLSDEFYADAESVAASVSNGLPFNLIHLKGAFKFDFFPAAADGFPQSELSRRRFIVSAMPGLENVRLPICSAEDAVLSKLVWFRQGGGVSDRQWHDVLGILSVQSARLDRVYLTDWANQLGVADLLEAAFHAATG